MKLARSVHRLDWWNLTKEFTPLQLASWQAMETIDPQGEARADLRLAAQTLLLMQFQCKEEIPQHVRESVAQAMTGYFRRHESRSSLSPAQLQALEKIRG